MLQKYLPLVAFLFLIVFAQAQVAQVEFGKNRVQYHNFFEDWSQYESENFVTYWYGMSRNAGQSVVQLAEYDFSEIQNILEHRINEKVQIVVYSDLTDVKQSNFGSEEVFTITGGQTQIVPNTVFVYFDGDHNNLRKQIRAGITEVYLNEMLFGSNIQEIVQNAVMMNLPNWFKKGLISFISESWNTELDSQLKDIVLSEDFKDFDQLAYMDPELAGHAFWYYVSEVYGMSIVTNLLYLTRINRSIESGLLFVLANSFETIAYDWEQFFKARYKKDALGREKVGGKAIPIKNKKNLPISTLKLSPDGTKLVYVLNETGKYKVYLYDLNTNEQKVISKGGFKNVFQATDLNYPQIAWNPNGAELAIISERRDQLALKLYDVASEKYQELILPQRFQRIFSIDYTEPYTILFSAAVSNHVDLFTYHTQTQLPKQLTNDYYDDRDAVFVKIDGEEGILFSSNRPDTLLTDVQRNDTVPLINTFDLYFYNLSRNLKELVRITNTPLSNEKQPVQINDSQFTYLSDRSGIYNREIGKLEDYIHHYEQKVIFTDGTDLRLHADSSLADLDTTLIDTIEIIPIIRQRAITHINSNSERNIIFQNNATKAKTVAVVVQASEKNEIYIQEINPQSVKNPPITTFQGKKRSLLKESTSQLLSMKADSVVVEEEKFPTETTQIQSIEDIVPQKDTIDPLENYFQSEFGNPLAQEELPEDNKSKEIQVLTDDIGRLPSATVFDFIRTGADGRNIHRFRPGQVTPYKLKFKTDYFATQPSNELLFEGFDSFVNGPQQAFGFQDLGILLKANIKDLLEDHVFEGGIRVPTNFSAVEYFVTYKNRKKRLDKHYAFYMKRQRRNQGANGFIPRRAENTVLLGQYSVSYPLNIFQSLRARATLRNDRLNQLITDLPSSNVPNQSATRAGIRLEYVYDNTIERGLNILNGTRVKVYGEIYKKVNFSTDQGLDIDFSDGTMTILSIDARHYEPLLKHSIFAVRLAANTSFGSERIQYFLGGTDNWLFAQTNDEIPITDNNYAFKVSAVNLRGFRSGIRNGNTYALINSELRVPLFKYLSRDIRSGFFKNFQLVGFFDVGTAWEGLTPYRDDNPLNTTVFQEGDIIDVTVNYFRDPIVAGYGFGARTVLLGTFIRADYAWGVETQIVQKPRLYISMGIDF